MAYEILKDNYYRSSVGPLGLELGIRYDAKTGDYELKEKRLEQQSLRKYLLNEKEHKCILCYKILPVCLLETAHIKPRNLLNYTWFDL